MAKRRLSQNQQRRIQANQQRRIIKTQDKSISDDVINDDNLGPEQTGTVIRHYRSHVDVETSSGENVRCKVRQNLNAIVCGDNVIWRAETQTTGVVTAVLPRKSVLTRPDQYDGIKVVVANIDQIFLVFCPLPELSERMLDRYLVATENANIETIILFNKTDLITQDELPEYQRRLAVYEKIGYKVLWLSHKTSDGIEQLHALLQDKVSIFVGQSGVGKSSLINSLHHTEVTQVNTVSEQSGLGQHTTTWSQLYHLPSGGSIIDSPGVREFGLWHLSAREIEAGFREFQPFIGTCKFRDCTHSGDPHCALEDACQRGEIERLRLENFRHLKTTSENKPS